MAIITYMASLVLVMLIQDDPSNVATTGYKLCPMEVRVCLIIIPGLIRLIEIGV
jgi:hypothetical protein